VASDDEEAAEACSVEASGAVAVHAATNSATTARVKG
jgi:hypothetical protein